LQKVKGPILIITGDDKNDIAYANGKSTFEAINHTPIFYGWQTDLQHIGTFGAKNAGENGAIAWNWLDWITRNDHDAEDAVQEAALRALRYFGTFSGGNARAWFLRRGLRRRPVPGRHARIVVPFRRFSAFFLLCFVRPLAPAASPS